MGNKRRLDKQQFAHAVRECHRVFGLGKSLVENAPKVLEKIAEQRMPSHQQVPARASRSLSMDPGPDNTHPVVSVRDLVKAIQRWRRSKVGTDYADWIQSEQHLHWVCSNVNLGDLGES